LTWRHAPATLVAVAAIEPVPAAQALGGQRASGWAAYVKISLFAFALSGLWNSLNLIVLPARIMDFVPADAKNTYLGALTSAGLLLAVLVQPLAGAASDGSRRRLGRRRPYLLAGGFVAALLVLTLGLAPGLLTLLLAYLGLQLFSNLAQGPYQALIPDLVPGHNRGRASAAKLGAEVIGIIALVPMTGYFIDLYREEGSVTWMWLALGTLAALVAIAAMLTLALVRERVPDTERARPAPLWAMLRQTFAVGWAEHADFKWYIVSRFFIVVAMSSIQAFAYYYLADVVGVDRPARVAGYLSLAGGAMVLALAYPAGRLGDRLGRKRMLYFSGTVGALGVIGLLLSQNAVQVVLSGAVLGGATCIFLVNSWALATDLVPQERAAHYLGLVNLAALGGVVARLWGPAIDFLNARNPGQGYTVLLLGCVVYIVMGTALLGLVRDQKHGGGS